MDFKELPYLVVGAGFFGAVIAERIAQVLDQRVVVIDKRDHIGGNSYSCNDSQTGIEYHKYGSHIFHTSNEKVWNYITQFTKFNQYQHHVLSQYRDQKYYMPINLKTINEFFKINIKSDEVEAFLAKKAKEAGEQDQDYLEGRAISMIGRELYEAFVKGYTLKQWETDPKTLPAAIINRLPIRHDENIRYFSDPYEGIPIDGYGKVFERMLDHPLIEVKTGVDFFEIKEQLDEKTLVIYSGPIDRYFDYQFGELGWRTLDFEKEIKDVQDFQGNTVVNYADIENKFTRTHEFKHYHPERFESHAYKQNKTVLFHEFSRTALKSDEPYYPINRDGDKKKFKQYQKLAKQQQNIIFGGRLGSYQYFDMHHVIAQALHVFESIIKTRLE